MIFGSFQWDNKNGLACWVKMTANTWNYSYCGTYALTTTIYDSEWTECVAECKWLEIHEVHAQTTTTKKEPRPLETNNNWMRIKAESEPLLHFDNAHSHRSFWIFIFCFCSFNFGYRIRFGIISLSFGKMLFSSILVSQRNIYALLLLCALSHGSLLL